MSQQTRLLQTDNASLHVAAALLQAGQLVAIPTETVYGLGADATSDQACAGIYTAKGRPSHNPLISHFPHATAALAEARDHFPLRRLAEQLARQFWPGPLTMVVPRHPQSNICQRASAGLPTIAVRVPAPPATRQLLALVGRPIAAPSANRSGRISPLCAQDVQAELQGRLAAIVDGGPAPVGVESTIIDLSGDHPLLLRPGFITPADLEEACATYGGLAHPAPAASASDKGTLTAPGQLTSHYAPTLPVVLGGQVNLQGTLEALLLFGPDEPDGLGVHAGLQGVDQQGRPWWNLSPKADRAQACSRLYAGLRWLDVEGRRLGCGLMRAPALNVLDPDKTGLGLVLADRLRRAAAPRGTTPTSR
ncbi:threonylcarbamoyl-AMP synthase [Formicincola oecophyllae]|uniref:Threonylcarbamoyl-AMP synthase n=2 Tax=Formicincola oecophyllae TaxID=2558361 RepID=A0A4Y6UA53_9PROT|nr:L-threonylcarbamoyladenylate synthase [Formicincola oecophyllae]QDH14282.1 threonylcarbamoyl-AMP synthase [Formicincola oecophyllae]